MGIQILLLLFLLSDALASQFPTFEDYPVRDIYKGKPAKVDLRSDPGARRFRTRLREGAAKGPNFAGHYTVVRWGCGTMCEAVAIVDALNGKVSFPLTFPPSNGMCYRLNSSLLITDPIDEDLVEGYGGKIPEWLKTRYFKWDGKGLIRITETTAVMKGTCDPIWMGN